MNFWREVWEQAITRPRWQWFAEGLLIGFILGGTAMALVLYYAEACTK